MAANSALMQLGEFQFSLENGVHQAMTRSLAWDWPTQGRIMRKPASQFVGPALDRISLDGVIYPGNSGTQGTIDQLKALADEGEPQMLTDGLGRVYGPMVVLSIKEDRTLFMDTGAARRIGFAIELQEYGEDNPGDRANPLSGTGLTGFTSEALGAVADVAQQVGAGSAFDALAWASSPSFAVDAGLARAAGFTDGALGAVASQVSGGNLPLLGGALNALGLQGLDPTQAGGWLAAGLNAAEMVGQLATGRGPDVAGIALGQLQGLAAGTLQSVLGNVAGAAAPALGDMVNAAGSLAPILSVDPQITAQVRSLLVLE